MVVLWCQSKKNEVRPPTPPQQWHVVVVTRSRATLTDILVRRPWLSSRSVDPTYSNERVKRQGHQQSKRRRHLLSSHSACYHHAVTRQQFRHFRGGNRNNNKNNKQDGASPSSWPLSLLEKSSIFGHNKLWNDEHQQREQWLQDRDRLLERVHRLARQINRPLSSSTTSSSLPDNQTSHRLALLLQSSFCIMVVGESNTGKSTLINALMGRKLLDMDSVPTTSQTNDNNNNEVTVLTSAATTMSNNDTKEDDSHHNLVRFVQVDQPPEWMKDGLVVIDTPEIYHPHLLSSISSFSNIHSHINSSWLQLLPHADFLLFCTSADRPLTVSERHVLRQLVRQRSTMATTTTSPSIMVVVTKMDLLEQTGGAYGAHEKQRMVDYVTQQLDTLQQQANQTKDKMRLSVVPLSARDALAAQQMRRHNTGHASSAVWKRSNVPTLERFFQDQLLAPNAKRRTKLLTAVGMAHAWIQQIWQPHLRHERNGLQSDQSLLQLLDSQWETWHSELEKELENVCRDVDALLEQEEQRGHVFLQRMSNSREGGGASGSPLRLYWTAVFDPDRLQREWDQTTPMYTSDNDIHLLSRSFQSILISRVCQAADDIALLGRAHGQSVIEFLGTRPAQREAARSVSHEESRQPCDGTATSRAPTWQAATTESQTRFVPSVMAASRFYDTRKNLATTWTQAVQRRVIPDDAQSFDQGQGVEHTTLPRQLQTHAEAVSAWTAGSLSCLALSGVGAMSWMAASTTPSLLVTGGTGLMLTSGLVLGTWTVYHAKIEREKLVTKYKQRLQEQRDQLLQDIRRIGTEELQRISRRIRDGVAPYQRHVESEVQRVDKLLDECDDIIENAEKLRDTIR